MPLLRHRVSIHVKATTQSALGESENWTPLTWKFARVFQLDPKARASYQQNQSQITHTILFNKDAVTITLGNNRIKYGTKTFEPVEPPFENGNYMKVMVKEI